MENFSTKVITNEVRLSFPHLFEAYANQPGQTAKFSTTILIPKNDVATKAKIDAAIQAAIQQGMGKAWNGVKPPIVPTPLHDGDGVRPSDGSAFGEECRGHWVMTASSKQPPQVVDQALNPIMSQTEIYAGVYARASLNFFPYNSNGRKGIGCGLNNVQKLRDGEPLTSRSTAQDDFTPIAGQAPQYKPQPQPQPQYQQAPVQDAPGGWSPNQGYPQAPQPHYQTAPQPQYQQAPVQPQYQQAPVQQAPVQQAPVQIDPITGQPIVPNMGY